jgi:hypothetical protein
MGFRRGSMRWARSDIGKAVDLAAAAVLAAAVAFASFMVGSALVGATLAPLALIVAYVGLTCIDDGGRIALADFQVTHIDARQEAAQDPNDEKVVQLFDPRQVAIARPSTASPGGVPEDAGQALSDALAQLKRSLR